MPNARFCRGSTAFEYASASFEEGYVHSQANVAFNWRDPRLQNRGHKKFWGIEALGGSLWANLKSSTCSAETDDNGVCSKLCRVVKTCQVFCAAIFPACRAASNPDTDQIAVHLVHIT